MKLATVPSIIMVTTNHVHLFPCVTEAHALSGHFILYNLMQSDTTALPHEAHNVHFLLNFMFITKVKGGVLLHYIESCFYFFLLPIDIHK